MAETKEKAGKLKVKRPKKLVKSDEPIKVDLSKTTKKTEELKDQQDAVPVRKTKEILVGESPGDSKSMDSRGTEQVQESSQDAEIQKEELPIIEEIIEEPVKEEEIIEIGEKMEVSDKAEAVISNELPKEDIPTLPENILKVIDFMKETGGTLEDYVRNRWNFRRLCKIKS